MDREYIIHKCLTALHNNEFPSAAAAARAYNLCERLVRRRALRNVTRQEARVEQQLLSLEQERLLVQWILDEERRGFAPTHARIRDFASRILQLNGGQKSVGHNWVPRFLKRWPNVRTKTGVTIANKRANQLTQSTVMDWYEELLSIMEEKKITPSTTWNMDEVGTALGNCYNQAVVGTSATKRTLVRRPQDREWCTVIECINADGCAIKPLLIFKAKHVQQQWFIPPDLPDWLFTASSNAFTTNQIGLRWLQDIFLPATADTVSEAGWRLLILDGHKSHVTEEFMDTCWLHKVWCHYLIAHASHILQPLDLTVFSSLKRKFRYLVADACEIEDSAPVKKQRFIEQYEIARELAITTANCKSGFKAAGIWPWDPSKGVDSHFILPDANLPCLPRNSDRQQQIPSSPHAYMTPRNGRQLLRTVRKVATSQSMDRTVRTLFRKTGKQLDRLAFELAESQATASSMTKKLDDIAAKRKQNRPVNPNLLFISREDVVLNHIGPPVPLLATTTTTVAVEPVSTPPPPPPASVDALDQVIASFRGVRATARSLQ